jgi:predicted dehydrogenase
VDKSTDPPTVLRRVPKDTPDQILLQAQLDSGVVLSFHVRGGLPMAGAETPAFVWRIYGEIGEIEVTGSSMLLNVGYAPGQKILLHDHRSQKTEEINIPVDNNIDSLPVPARNIGRVYEKYAEIRGKKSAEPTENALVSFDEALKRHELIAEMLRRWDEGQ